MLCMDKSTRLGSDVMSITAFSRSDWSTSKVAVPVSLLMTVNVSPALLKMSTPLNCSPVRLASCSLSTSNSVWKAPVLSPKIPSDIVLSWLILSTILEAVSKTPS